MSFNPQRWFITFDGEEIEVSQDTFEAFKYPPMYSDGPDSAQIGILVKKPEPLYPS